MAADRSKCRASDCPRKGLCWRYTAPSFARLRWTPIKAPADGEDCPHFLPLRAVNAGYCKERPKYAPRALTLK